METRNFCTDVTVPSHLHYLSFHGCQINRTSDSFLHNTFPSCLSRIFFRCMFSLKWLFSPKLPSACPSGQCIITLSFVGVVSVLSSFKKFMVLFISLTTFTDFIFETLCLNLSLSLQVFPHSCIQSFDETAWDLSTDCHSNSIYQLLHLLSLSLYLPPFLSAFCNLNT